MSIEFETRENTKSIEKPENIPRHTHDGINSVQIDLLDVRKRVLPKDNGTNYQYNGVPIFVGKATGYAGSAPFLDLEDEATVSQVNAWISATHSLLLDLIERQETHSRVFVNNNFATYTQNPASDAYDPLFTYFDRQ